MFKLHPKASSSPSPRRPSFGQAGLRQAPRNCVFFSNKTWWFWSYQTLGLGMFFFCMNTGVFVLVREENRDWWWMVRNCRLESGPHLRYLRGYTVIYSSYKPLMWVKQSQTTHLGMVYTSYKNGDDGGRVYEMVLYGILISIPLISWGFRQSRVWWSPIMFGLSGKGQLDYQSAND